MRLLLYPHGGSGNHGCEAIVRSTVSLTGAHAVLASSAPQEDLLYGLDRCCRIVRDRKPLKRLSTNYVGAYFRHNLLNDADAFDKLAFRPVFQAAEQCDIALSIGGDNYCYGEPRHLYLIDRELRKKGVKTVLWGCSIDPEALQGEMLEDLKGFDHIVTRESLSYKALRGKGLPNVSLFPDPAFLLKRKLAILPEGFVEGNTVGINISPLIMSYEKREGVVLLNYIRLIETILKKTEMAIALIPHVVWARNDDRIPLKHLFDRFKDSGRLSLVEDQSAEHLKDIFSRCRFVVAARTHATIAAWSSCVPSLAVGYSIKARGIARDLFGDANSPVLPIQSLQSENDLSDRFLRLVASESDIQNRFRGFMPEYLAKAAEANNILMDLIQ